MAIACGSGANPPRRRAEPCRNARQNLRLHPPKARPYRAQDRRTAAPARCKSILAVPPTRAATPPSQPRALGYFSSLSPITCSQRLTSGVLWLCSFRSGTWCFCTHVAHPLPQFLPIKRRASAPLCPAHPPHHTGETTPALRCWQHGTAGNRR